jgi:endo-1,4-beta-xylanase
MSFDAFISYSSRDKAAADATCAVLESAGVRCWIAPRDIHAGAEYGAAIVDAIDRCRVMILVFSSSANTSGQIHREIERAVAKGIPVLPVRIEDVMPTKSLEYFLGAIHWLDAFSPPLEQHLQQLAEIVKAMLKIEPGAGARPADGDAARKFTPRTAGPAEIAERRAENTRKTAGAFRLFATIPLPANWLLPAISAVALVALVAGGVWLYHLGTLATGGSPGPASPRPPAFTTLRAAAQARDFLIGTAVPLAPLRDETLYEQMLTQEYNLVEPEVETRFYRVRPNRTDFNFADLDLIMDFAGSHGMKVRGSPLVSEGLLPDWLTKGNFSPSEISAMLKEYIQTMLRRYRGRVYSWDIAWGMFDNLGGQREFFWTKAIGADYIEQVVAWAREADPHAKLFLNNNYAFEPLGPRSDAAYGLARKLRARGIPIDGMAIASFWLLDHVPKFQEVAANMARLAALGLELHVVEFDLSIPLPPTDEDLQKQAAVYRDYLAACLSVTACKSFLTWGFTDKHAWAPNRWPGMNVGAAMPFDAAYKPKLAYKAMLDVLRGSQSAMR